LPLNPVFDRRSVVEVSTRTSLLLAGLALIVGAGCDMSMRAWGQVKSPAQQPIPETRVLVTGYSDQVHPVSVDGSFDVAIVHGGKVRWVFEAPGYRSAETTLKGSAQYQCDVVLVQDRAGSTVKSSVACKQSRESRPPWRPIRSQE
jgi:hypothetical protein